MESPDSSWLPEALDLPRPPKLPASVLEIIGALSVSCVSVSSRSQSLPWVSAPPWRVPVSSAPPWWAPVSSAPPWWAPVSSAPPWWAPVSSAPPWWAPVSSAPPWWAPVSSAPPWRATVSSAPPWWASVSSAPPWWAPDLPESPHASADLPESPHTFPSTITPITQLSPITHQPWLSCHTCTSFTHPHISSTLPYTRCEVLFLPRLTFLSVYHSLWLLLLCLTPDCLTLELWTCACDLDPCLVLFTSLLCLWYSCYCPLTIACLILPLSK